MYNPDERVQAFIGKYGLFGKAILDAYNTVDPFSVYYGEDCNPDEYLSYGEMFMLGISTNRSLYESVKDSFHPDSYSEGFLTEKHALEIANRISNCLDRFHP